MDDATRPGPVLVGSRDLTIDDVVAVARGFAPVQLCPSVQPRLEAARSVVMQALEGGDSIYGLTTGLGAAVDTRLAADAIPAFQQRAIQARAVGVGERCSTEEVRALLLARLAGLCQGASGISPALVATIADMLNKRVHPVVRRIGSLGEADLSALAQAFLPLAAAGEAEYDGALLGGADAMVAAEIPLPLFGPKDGLALLNANAQSIGLGALAVADILAALDAGVIAGALSLEAFRANLSPLDDDLSRLRGMPGHAEGVRAVKAALAGSDLFVAGTARRVQDPLSFRCMAPVIGHALLSAAAARAMVEAELASVADSPAVLVERAAMLSSVNFDTTELALTFEAIGLAMSHVAVICAARIMKLMSPVMSDLPRFLSRHGGTHSGFATTQKTVAALEAEIRHLALPMGAMTLAVADGVEDYAPMTPRIVEKTHAIAWRLARLVAVELVVAAEAVDLRNGITHGHSITLGHGTNKAHAFVRKHIARLDDDRPMGVEYERLALSILEGEFGLAVSSSSERPCA